MKPERRSAEAYVFLLLISLYLLHWSPISNETGQSQRVCRVLPMHAGQDGAVAEQRLAMALRNIYLAWKQMHSTVCAYLLFMTDSILWFRDPTGTQKVHTVETSDKDQTGHRNNHLFTCASPAKKKINLQIYFEVYFFKKNMEWRTEG